MHTIVLNTQKNNESMDIDLLNTHMACGAITLNLVNYSSYMAILDCNMSTLVMLKILLSP